MRDRSAAYAAEHGQAPSVAVPLLDLPRAADRRVDVVNLLTVAGIEAVDVADSTAAVTLGTTDQGYEGVAKDMDVVAFLTALLDEMGAPA